jgi:hypothetical protein
VVVFVDMLVDGWVVAPTDGGFEGVVVVDDGWAIDAVVVEVAMALAVDVLPLDPHAAPSTTRAAAPIARALIGRRRACFRAGGGAPVGGSLRAASRLCIADRSSRVAGP